jgi:putative ABC transport system permease protein
VIKNYLLTAIRNLIKNSLFSFINILGLTIGMTACLFILYYVNYEKSFDRSYENHDRIYRLRYERTDQAGQAVRFASCCPPAALHIRGRYPEVEKIARIFRYPASVSYGENKFFENRMFFAEPDFLAILKFKFIEGDPLNGIREPNKAFISQSTAQKYFGDQNPIGKTISVDKKIDYQISGLFADIPLNSHLKFDILLSYPNLISIYGQDIEDSWGDTGFFTYILFKPLVDAQAFENKMPALVETEWGEVLKEYKLKCDLKLQRLKDIHLTSHFMQEYEVNGDLDTVNFLTMIAAFIIIIAWVNYVNLSTARSLTRAKEVGLRKVVGASRVQLVIQFFIETVIINAAAVLLTCGLVELSLPFFSRLSGIPMDYHIWLQMWFWYAIAIMFLCGIFLSGLYPVVVLSSFQPATVLKGKLGNAAEGINLRKALLVFQFVMAFVLITGTVTVYRQLSFMKNQDPGFNMDRIIAIKAPRVREASFESKLQTFKDLLLSDSNVGKFCVVTEMPGRQIYWDAGAIRRAGTDEGESKNYLIVGVDYDFVDLFDLKLVAGRNFSKEFPADKEALMLNETAAKWLGFADPRSAIGEKIDYWGDIYTVIGVLKDYHQQSLKMNFEPQIYRFLPQGRGVRGYFALQINMQNVKSTLKMIQERYGEFFPGNPFEYFFLDEYYNQQYRADELFGTVLRLFSFLLIFVTSLGILGLSSFMVMQRTKEIGIRKVLGAGVPRILILLIKDFLLLIVLSFIIAVPVSYFAMNSWLDSFATRMDMTTGLFLFPLVIVIFVTCLTLCSHIIKAALANPVQSLRYE